MWAVEEVYDGRAQRWEFATEALAAAYFQDLRLWWLSGMDAAASSASTSAQLLPLGDGDYLRLVCQ